MNSHMVSGSMSVDCGAKRVASHGGCTDWKPSDCQSCVVDSQIVGGSKTESRWSQSPRVSVDELGTEALERNASSASQSGTVWSGVLDVSCVTGSDESVLAGGGLSRAPRSTEAARDSR